MRREQLGALPSTFTTDGRAGRPPASPARAGSGGGTSRTRVGVRPPNTSGKPLVSMVSRSASYSARGLLGHHPVDAVEHGAVAHRAGQPRASTTEASGAATIQATSSTASTETNAPPMSSTAPPAPAADRVPQARADPAGQRLAEHRQAEDGDQRHEHPRSPSSSNCSGEQRAELQPDQRAAEEPENDSAPMTNPCR